MKIYGVWNAEVLSNISRDGGVASSSKNTEEAGGPLATWERLASPEGPCQRYFENALFIAFADPDHPLARKFLDWALETSQRALDDPRFDVESENRSKGWRNIPNFPGNQGQVRAILALSSAMRSRAVLDLDQLRLAADQIEQSALAKKGKDWAEQFIQGRYLFSVRLRMICGDWVAARKALNIKRKFDAVSGQHQVLLELVDAILATKDLGELPAQRGFQRFEEYFAAVRGPEGDLRIKEDSGWVDCGYRFELSMVRHRIFSASSSFPDWSDVFRAISAESS